MPADIPGKPANCSVFFEDRPGFSVEPPAAPSRSYPYREWFGLLLLTLVIPAVRSQPITYENIPFPEMYNFRIQNLGVGCAAQYPTGQLLFAGIPFYIEPTGNNSWNSNVATGPNPRVIDIPVNIFGVREIYTLMNTGWGEPGPNSYASLEAFGSEGAYYNKQLIGNSDIRDWLQAFWTNNINNTSTINVFSVCTGQGNNVRLDKQRLVLPSAFNCQTLATVRISDNGAFEFQRVFIAGLTVGYADDQPVIYHQPVDAAGCHGGIVTLTVATTAVQPTYQWRRGETPLSNGGNISGADTATLVIVPLISEDAAEDYNCLITTACGSITSNAAVVSVIPSGGGDASGDGETNGEDIQGFVNILLGGGGPSVSFCACDMDQNGTVNLADVPLFANALVMP